MPATVGSHVEARSLRFVTAAVIALAACTPKNGPSPTRNGSNHPVTARPIERDDRAASDAARGAQTTEPDDRCGYVDGKGQPVIARRFEDAEDFSSGRAAVREHGKRGFIDAAGAYVIKPVFDEAKGFSDGLAAVCVRGRGWGFIDTTGAWVIPAGFAAADSFSDGVAVIKDAPASSGDGLTRTRRVLGGFDLHRGPVEKGADDQRAGARGPGALCARRARPTFRRRGCE